MIRPLSDWLLVELEEDRSITEAGLHLVRGSYTRVGKVLAKGPGRQYKRNFVPTEVQAGDRVVFLHGLLKTAQAKAVSHVLDSGFVLIRETDVLMVVVGNVKIDL